MSGRKLPVGDQTDSDIAINDNRVFNTTANINVATSTTIVLFDSTIITAEKFSVSTSAITFNEGVQPDLDNAETILMLYLQAPDNAKLSVPLVNGTVTMRLYSSEEPGISSLAISSPTVYIDDISTQIGFR